jgi:hypothetical protein
MKKFIHRMQCTQGTKCTVTAVHTVWKFIIFPASACSELYMGKELFRSVHAYRKGLGKMRSLMSIQWVGIDEGGGVGGGVEGGSETRSL